MLVKRFPIALLALGPVAVAGLEPHPDALPNTHAPGVVDEAWKVKYIVRDPASLEGIVLDETEAELVGEWQYSTHTPPYVGVGYLHDRKSGKGEKAVIWRPEIPESGHYELRLSHCYNVRRSTRAPVRIVHADGETLVEINQQKPPAHGKLFRTLGVFRFAKGGGAEVRISNGGTEEDKVVIADAIHLLPVEAGRAVLVEDFEGEAEGELFRWLLENPWAKAEEGRLAVTYRGSAEGSERVAVTVPLGEVGSDYTLSYDVHFKEGFQFVRGGKLPGLGPLNHVTGGGKGREDGWSARLMWREDGRVVSYVYHQDQPGKTGDYREGTGFQFVPGKTYRVTLHVRVNTGPDRSDGVVRASIDGKEVVAHDGLKLHAVSDTSGHVGVLLFHTFHGGSDASWAPRGPDGGFGEVRAWFDNVSVVRGAPVGAD